MKHSLGLVCGLHLLRIPLSLTGPGDLWWLTLLTYGNKSCSSTYLHCTLFPPGLPQCALLPKLNLICWPALHCDLWGCILLPVIKAVQSHLTSLDQSIPTLCTWSSHSRQWNHWLWSLDTWLPQPHSKPTSFKVYFKWAGDHNLISYRDWFLVPVWRYMGNFVNDRDTVGRILQRCVIWNWLPPQYSCLENSMDRGAWWATVHGVTKSQTPLTNINTEYIHQGVSLQKPPL